MYKDKDKQREANREASQRRRDKGMTKQMSNEGMTARNGTLNVIPSSKRGKDIKCFADLPPDVQDTISLMSQRDGKIDKDEKAKRTLAAIKYQHLFPDRYEPVSLAERVGLCVTGKPGDSDYNGICTEEWRAERGR